MHAASERDHDSIANHLIDPAFGTGVTDGGEVRQGVSHGRPSGYVPPMAGRRSSFGMDFRVSRMVIEIFSERGMTEPLLAVDVRLVQ
jgi:hypothetical protein